MTYWKGIGHSWSDCAISLRRFSQGSPYDRKSRLEGVVQALEQERRGLTSYLEAQTLTIEQIEGFRDFATEVCQGLEATDEDFQALRDIVETLDLRASLVVEGGGAWCMFDASLEKTVCRLRRRLLEVGYAMYKTASCSQLV
jgi:hypothetical protein